MTWLSAVVVYILVWWVTLFAVLPLWVAPTEPDDVGHGTGAPKNPHMLRKLALTTAIAAVIWLGIFLVVSSPWLSFRDSRGWPEDASSSTMAR